MRVLVDTTGVLFLSTARWLIPALVVVLFGFYVAEAFAYGPIFTSDGTRDIQYARVMSDVTGEPATPYGQSKFDAEAAKLDWRPIRSGLDQIVSSAWAWHSRRDPAGEAD